MHVHKKRAQAASLVPSARLEPAQMQKHNNLKRLSGAMCHIGTSADAQTKCTASLVPGATVAPVQMHKPEHPLWCQVPCWHQCRCPNLNILAGAWCRIGTSAYARNLIILSGAWCLVPHWHQRRCNHKLHSLSGAKCRIGTSADAKQNKLHRLSGARCHTGASAYAQT